jgi:hypothetical protein
MVYVIERSHSYLGFPDASSAFDAIPVGIQQVFPRPENREKQA